MVEIIGIIFFARKMGTLANQKGLSVGWWRFYAVLTWVLAEIAGAFLAGMFGVEDRLLIVLCAYVTVFVACFILYKRLNARPDMTYDFDFDQHKES